MQWHGEIAFGDVALAFRGASAENRFHAHAAIQCVVGDGGLELVDAAGVSHRGTGWLVRSGVTHCLRPAAHLVLVLIEPQSRLALGLLRHATEGPITPLSPALTHELAAAPSAAAVLTSLSRLVEGPDATVDRRVLAAMAYLDRGQSRDAAAAAARHAGISSSQLRALCRTQFGVPFSKLLLWRKVRRACIAMGAGHSLADVALEAGFADQAHLTRTMAEVIGLTAGEAARAGE